MADEIREPDPATSEAPGDGAPAPAGGAEAAAPEAPQPPTMQQLLDQLADQRQQIATLSNVVSQVVGSVTRPAQPQPAVEDDGLDAELHAIATRTQDPVARAVLRAERRTAQLATTVAEALRRTQGQTFLDRLPTDERAEFDEFVRKEGAKFNAYDVAYEVFKARREASAPAPRPAPRPRAPEPDRRSPAPVVSREVSAGEAKRRKMTADDYDRQVETLHSQGRHREARDLQAQYAQGQIEVLD